MDLGEGEGLRSCLRSRNLSVLGEREAQASSGFVDSGESFAIDVACFPLRLEAPAMPPRWEKVEAWRALKVERLRHVLQHASREMGRCACESHKLQAQCDAAVGGRHIGVCGKRC